MCVSFSFQKLITKNEIFNEKKKNIENCELCTFLIIVIVFCLNDCILNVKYLLEFYCYFHSM